MSERDVMHIRASMLPGAADCMRRAIARYYAREITDAGYTLHQTRPTIGSVVGTAVHRGISVLLRQPRPWTADIMTDATYQGFAVLEDVFTRGDGAELDDITRTLGDAQRQTVQLITAWCNALGESVQPILVEHTFTAAVAQDTILYGTIDVLDGATIRDIKTGTRERPYTEQLGAYVLLAQAFGHAVTGAVTDFIKRRAVRRVRASEAVITTQYNIDTATYRARIMIRDIVFALRRWHKSGRADPDQIPANPMSLMCSQKYCPAWGTDFCNAWRK